MLRIRYKTVLTQQSQVLYLDAIIGECSFSYTIVSPLAFFLYLCGYVINYHTIECKIVKILQ